MTDKNKDMVSKLTELLEKRQEETPHSELISYLTEISNIIDRAYSSISYQDPLYVSITKTIKTEETYHDQKAIEMILSWREKYPLSKRVVSGHIATIRNSGNKLEGYWHHGKVICYITSPGVDTFIEIPKYSCVWRNKDSQEYLLSFLEGIER